jgi:hypothetical protein
MAKKDQCKCMKALFTYAEDSKNAKQLARRGECWAGTLIAGRIEKSIVQMRENCALDIGPASVTNAKQVKEMFEAHSPADKLSYKEKQAMLSSLDIIEEHVLRGIQQCGGK